jgi:hypothetical protein
VAPGRSSSPTRRRDRKGPGRGCRAGKASRRTRHGPCRARTRCRAVRRSRLAGAAPVRGRQARVRARPCNRGDEAPQDGAKARPASDGRALASFLVEVRADLVGPGDDPELRRHRAGARGGGP